MTRQLTWRDDWSLGMEQLDADHRRMVDLLNLLFAAPDSPSADTAPTDVDLSRTTAAGATGHEVLLERLDSVVDHLRAHFEREEAFLRSIDFPDYDEHSSEHALQMAEFADLRRDLQGRKAHRLDEETIDGIKRWFFNHVIAEDHRFAAYYFEQILERREDWNNIRRTNAGPRSQTA